MARPSGGTFIGLDIGTQTIKVVEVRGAGNSLTVTAVGIDNTPPGLVQGGHIADPKELGAAVKAVLAKAGIRGGRVVSSAAGANTVVVRVIEVPKMTPKELAETMKWEVERHIPFAANDVEMSFQAIDDPQQVTADPNNPNMEVLLAVAQRDMVANHLQVIQATGLKPVAIDVEPLAVGRALIDLDRTGSQMKNVVVVNIGAANTDVSVFKQGTLRFPRTIPIAGDNFTRAISDHLGLTMDQAEEEKRANAAVLMEYVGAPGGDFATDAGFGIDTNPFGGGGIPSPFGEPQPSSPFDQPVQPAPDNPFATPPPVDNPFATPPEDNPFGPIPSGDAPLAATPAPAVPDDPRAVRRKEIFDALLPVLSEFTMELRRSVDYFRSRYPAENLDKIILCGGSARLPGLDQFVSNDLGIPTEVANPFANVNMQAKQVGPDVLQQSAPAFAVALGLAARDAVLGPDK